MLVTACPCLSLDLACEVVGERENGRSRGRHARGEGVFSPLAWRLLAPPFFLVPTTSKRLLRRLLYTFLPGTVEKGSMLTIKNCVVFFFSNDEGSFALAWDNLPSKMYQLSLWYSVSSSSSQPFRRRNFRCSF